MSDQEGRFEEIEEVAERLLVDPQTVRRWIKSGRLKAYKPGREYRILSQDLDAFLESRSYPKAQAPPSEPEGTEERRKALRVLENTAEQLYTSFAYLYNDRGREPKEPTAVEVGRFEEAVNQLATVFFNFLDEIEREGYATHPPLRESLLATLDEVLPLCTKWVLQHSSGENVVVTHLDTKGRQRAEGLRRAA
jgi:excisionase family DNA binding protein